VSDLLRVLLVEDSEDDAVLLLRELEKGGIRPRFLRVESREGLVSALETDEWDVVIADYVLPGFSGIEALKTAKKLRPALPFIMISGKMDEEIVIEALKKGAVDYVMKDKLFRLCPAVNQALQSRKLYERMKTADRELQKVVSRYHLLAENIIDIIWTMDMQRKLTFISPSVIHVLGYRIEDLVGKKLDDLLFPGYIETVDEVMRQWLQRLKKNKKKRVQFKDVFEMEIRKKSGQPLWMETKVVSLTDERGRPSGFLGVSRDISDRKKKEKEIIILATAFKQIDEGVVITDGEGIILYINEAFRRQSGFTRKSFMGTPLGKLEYESELNHDRQSLQAAFGKGKSWKGRLERKRKNGVSYQVNASLTPIRDEDGKVSNFVYIERDITLELKIQNKFLEMQKMEAMGTLAGGIAHDFNNILMPIIVNSEMLLWDVGKDDPQNVYFNQILESAKRGKELVKQIISYSRQSSVQKKPIDLVPLIKDSVSFLRASLPSTIQIETVINAHDVLIEGNPTQIHQVIMNLITNAADAIGAKGGRIKITLDHHETEAVNAHPESQLKEKPYARISVEDSGTGIDPGILNKIFDPFFSTKDPGKGSGMGLSVARRITHDHGGTISVDSEPDKGAVFHIYLPLTDRSLYREKEHTGSLRGGNERILLVDDEPPLVESLQNMLGKMGYDVTGVMSSKEALDVFKARSDEIDLVITDQTMPGMTGVDIVKEMIRIQPRVPFIMMTGFSETVSEKESESLGIDAFVMKPISTRTMAATIRRVLDRKR